MEIELRKIAVTDGADIYEMMQELLANENGHINCVARNRGTWKNTFVPFA